MHFDDKRSVKVLMFLLFIIRSVQVLVFFLLLVQRGVYFTVRYSCFWFCQLKSTSIFELIKWTVFKLKKSVESKNTP